MTVYYDDSSLRSFGKTEAICSGIVRGSSGQIASAAIAFSQRRFITITRLCEVLEKLKQSVPVLLQGSSGQIASAAIAFSQRRFTTMTRLCEVLEKLKQSVPV
jgi:hypothetical protein